jgi:hypothetical protein
MFALVSKFIRPGKDVAQKPNALILAAGVGLDGVLQVTQLISQRWVL